MDNLKIAIIGITLLGVFHSYFFSILKKFLPSENWIKKGLFWGIVIWTLYWIYGEWFIYKIVINKPIIINYYSLTILLIGAAIEGLVISYFLDKKLIHLKTLKNYY